MPRVRMIMVVGIDPLLRSLGPCSEVRNHVPRNDDQEDEAYEEEENPAESEWHRVLLRTNLAAWLQRRRVARVPGYAQLETGLAAAFRFEMGLCG
jgi:hypothetical protein